MEVAMIDRQASRGGSMRSWLFGHLGRSCRAWHAAAVLAIVPAAACTREGPQERGFEFERMATRPAEPGHRVYEMEWAAIHAPDADVASTFAEEIRGAAAAFYTTFGIRVPRGCVRAIGSSAAVPCTVSGAWSMDWPVTDVVAPMPDGPYRRLVQFGLLKDNSLNRAGSSLASRGACQERSQSITVATTLRHELMHQFFMSMLWPNTRGSDHYGGDAPDWLDEAVAIAGEPPYLVRSRRARFMQMIARGAVIPIDRFLRMEHPVMSSLRYNPPRVAEGQSTVTFRRQPKASKDAARVLDFFAQAKAFSDYLVAASNDQRVLLRVTANLKMNGGPGVISGLPHEPAKIQQGFLEWVAAQRWTDDDSTCL